jgi:hypothetical protein
MQISKSKPAIQLFAKKEKIFYFTHLNANGVSGLADLGYRGAAWRQDHEKLIDRLAGTHRIVRACVPLMLSVGLLRLICPSNSTGLLSKVIEEEQGPDS